MKLLTWVRPDIWSIVITVWKQFHLPLRENLGKMNVFQNTLRQLFRHFALIFTVSEGLQKRISSYLHPRSSAYGVRGLWLAS